MTDHSDLIAGLRAHAGFVENGGCAEHSLTDVAALLHRAASALSSLSLSLSEAIDALSECEEYFDNRADADCNQDGFIPNKEMRLLSVVRTALQALENGKPVLADATNDPADLSSLRKGAEVAVDVLEQCEAYFDNRADADCEGDPAEFVPNKEMILLSAIREAIAALVSGSREER